MEVANSSLPAGAVLQTADAHCMSCSGSLSSRPDAPHTALHSMMRHALALHTMVPKPKVCCSTGSILRHTMESAKHIHTVRCLCLCCNKFDSKHHSEGGSPLRKLLKPALLFNGACTTQSAVSSPVCSPRPLLRGCSERCITECPRRAHHGHSAPRPWLRERSKPHLCMCTCTVSAFLQSFR